ncbi:uncharacterized protein [Haliotis asinina]|uniref:uncharacterized protein n=1 Tax=Haliotis asinina TaxID=109174 RepID=UPI003532339E
MDLERKFAPTKSWDEVPLEHISASKENPIDGTEETRRNQKEETKLQGTEKTAKEHNTQVIPFAEDISDCEKEDKDTTDKNALLQESLDTREEDKDVQKPTGVSFAKWTIASRKRARRHKLQPKLSETVLQNNDLKNKVRESKKDQQKRKKAEKVNDRRELSGFCLLICDSSISININIITTGNNSVYNTYDHGVDVKNITSILFRVKGCTDGKINLFEGPDFTTAKNALVLLGGWGNHKSLIHPCSGCTALESEWFTSVLNCNEMTPIWINWTGRLLSVGHGAYIGEQTFMSTEQERDFDVQYLGVGSSYDHVFDWEFDGYPGNYFERVVPYGWSTRQMLSSVTASSMVNCIRSCQGRISCGSVSYQSTTSTCQLYFERSRPVDIHPDNTWETWTERNM